MKKNNQLFESARKHVDKYAATILGRISDEKEVGSPNVRSLKSLELGQRRCLDSYYCRTVFTQFELT